MVSPRQRSEHVFELASAPRAPATATATATAHDPPPPVTVPAQKPAAAPSGPAAAPSSNGQPTEERYPKRPHTVLVLGGGGMRGMAHVGVLKALETLGIRYDAVVGTSIGALVGAMAAADYPAAKMEQIIYQLKKEEYFRLNFVKLLLRGTAAPSMYRGDLFQDRLREILPDGGFRDLVLPFYCNAVRLESGGSVFWGAPGMDDVSLVDAVYSSCALPGIFEPFERDGFHYMDGGLVDPIPLRFAKSLRPELIIAVDLTIKATFKAPNYKSKVVSTMFRAFEIAEEVIVEHLLHMHGDHNVVLIQPKVGHLHRFDFDEVEDVVNRGEEEALRVLTSHAATRMHVKEDLVPGLACPVQPRDYVSVRIDPSKCIGCGMCSAVCETDAFFASIPGERATVRKLSHYECTRDHACARNCPVDAISLGNL